MKFNKSMLKRVKAFLMGAFAISSLIGIQHGYISSANTEYSSISEEWAVSLNSSQSWFNGFTKLKNGEYIAVGYAKVEELGLASEGDLDAIIVCYDNNGVQKWVRSFGGSDKDRFYNISQLNDGSFILEGKTFSPEFNANMNGQGLLVKYDDSWNIQWTKTLGNMFNSDYYEIEATLDGGFIACGNIYKGPSSQALMEKYDAQGNLEWEYRTQLISGNRDSFNSVIETSRGDFIAVGKKSNKNVVTKVNREGGLIWEKTFIEATSLSDITETDNNEFFIAGSLNDNGVIIKCNSNGDILIPKITSTIKPTNIVSRDNNSFIIAGARKSYTNSEMKAINTKGYLIWNIDMRSIGTITDVEIHGKEIVITMNNTENGATLLKFKEKSPEEKAVEQAEMSKEPVDVETARDLVNKLPESLEKNQLQDRLNIIIADIVMEKKTTTSNVDIYIKSKNSLSLSLDTNSVSFDNFSGTEDIEKLNAVNLTVNSSLPYKINAYLPTEITGSRSVTPMDKSILNIRANGEATYNTFANLTTPIILLDNQIAGNTLTHGIDLMLKGGISHDKDVYKATVKLEVEQK